MKKYYIDEMNVESVNVLVEAASRKISNNKCPDCNRVMKCEIKESAIITYIIHTCKCGFKREDFV